jgi:hypothetical protein
MTTLIAVAALIGWAYAGFATGMWRGERQARIFIENYKAYGQSEPAAKAESWADETPESRVEDTIDKMESLMGQRVTSPGAENGRLEFDSETVEQGVEYLLAMAKEDGQQLSRKDAEEEVERMLNAEGPDML